MKKMYGVNVPMSCPMHADGSVDYEGVKSLARYLIGAGVNGLYPNGSTGEMCFLTLDERKKILENVLEAAEGKVNVFSMVGAGSTQDTIELARHAAEGGADGIGVVTPWYFKLDDAELLQYFKDVAASVPEDFPIYLYGIPQCSVNDITLSLAEKVADACPNVVGIKYSFGDVARMLHMREIRNRTFSVLVGPDDLFLAVLACGGDGVISGTSNAIPEHYVAMYKAWVNGDVELAQKIMAKILRLHRVVSGPNHMARYKAVLKRRGVIECAAMRRPFRELTPEEEKHFFETIDAMAYLAPDEML